MEGVCGHTPINEGGSCRNGDAVTTTLCSGEVVLTANVGWLSGLSGSIACGYVSAFCVLNGYRRTEIG